MKHFIFLTLFYSFSVVADGLQSSGTHDHGHNHGHHDHDHAHHHNHGHSHHGHSHHDHDKKGGFQCEAVLQSGNLLARTWMEAQGQISEIDAALADLKPEDQALGKKIRAAIEAALGKHHEIYAHARSVKNKDIGRHMTILRSIAAFDPNLPQFSLYRIKRSIEGRYSLREYIECKD